MKTIIFYATKYGAASVIAQRIADKINGAVICNLKQAVLPPLEDFDCIIIGASLYAGSIRKEAKDFLFKREDILLGKKIGLFLTGIGAEGEETFFKDNFPYDLMQKAAAKSFLGGIFDPKKAGMFERFIIRIVTKRSGYINTINDLRIDQFVKEIKAGV